MITLDAVRHVADQPRSAPRLRNLDLLRTVAIALVLGRHMVVCPEDVSPFLHRLTVVWQRGGWVGVDLFFVLSGFLISGLLFTEHQRRGTIRFGRFFVRRGFKIYPPFLVLIATTVIVNTALGLPVPMAALARELTFLQNYGRGLWVHTWSLAVEEHFYIALPLLLIAMQRAARSFRPLPAVFAVIAATCLGMRIAVAASLPFDDARNVFPTHLRVDSLFSGVMLSYLFHYHRDRVLAFASRWQRWLLPGAIACYVPWFVIPEQAQVVHTIGFSILWLGGVLLLLRSIPDDAAPTPGVRALSFIGSRSYSIYLWHVAAGTWGVGLPMRLLFGGFNWYYYAASYLIGAVAGGIVMAAVVEYPMLRLRDRLFPRRAEAVAAPPPLAALL